MRSLFPAAASKEPAARGSGNVQMLRHSTFSIRRSRKTSSWTKGRATAVCRCPRWQRGLYADPVVKGPVSRPSIRSDLVSGSMRNRHPAGNGSEPHHVTFHRDGWPGPVCGWSGVSTPATGTGRLAHHLPAGSFRCHGTARPRHGGSRWGVANRPPMGTSQHHRTSQLRTARPTRRYRISPRGLGQCPWMSQISRSHEDAAGSATIPALYERADAEVEM